MRRKFLLSRRKVLHVYLGAWGFPGEIGGLALSSSSAECTLAWPSACVKGGVGGGGVGMGGGGGEEVMGRCLDFTSIGANMILKEKKFSELFLPF